MTTRLQLGAVGLCGLLCAVPAGAQGFGALGDALGKKAEKALAGGGDKAQQAAADPVGDSAARVKKAYEGFDAAKACAQTSDCGRALRDAAGIEALPHGPYDPVKMFNPHGGMPNPDPEWLVGWDALPQGNGANEAEKVFRVMATAAGIKQARANCLELFKKQLYPEYTAADAKVVQAIDAALAKGGTHDKVAALLALRKMPEARSPAGARFQLETKLAELISTPALQVVWRADHLDQGADPKQLRPTLSEEVEATLYCAGRMANVRAEGVRQPFTDAELATARKAEADARAYQAPATAEASSLALTDGADFKAPFIASALMKITAVTPAKKGGGMRVEAEAKKEEQMVMGCKQTKDRVIIENGKAQYDKSCTYGGHTTLSTVKLELADLPQAGLQKGDEVTLTVAVKEVKSKTTRPAANKEVFSQVFTADSAVVRKVTRGGSVIYSLAQ